jgi:hypothetical protein
VRGFLTSRRKSLIFELHTSLVIANRFGSA